MATDTKTITERWQSSWTSLDPDAITDLYTDNGIHMSNVVVERMGIASGTLKSRAAIRLYVEESVKRLKSFRAEIIKVTSAETEIGGSATIEYWRILNENMERKSRVCEIIDWEGDKITSCRVYHF
tara:strand:- start:11348 stop:11725 length:378 start_codon:yes stop_codon:yes gene_type:complete